MLNAGQSDNLVYRWASVTLRAGMYSSFALMIFGLLWWLLQGSGGSAQLTVPLDRLPAELAALNPLAYLNLGVLLLLATPGITLLTIIAGFAASRVWTYVWIASLVAMILLISLAVSFKWIKLF